MSCGGVMTATAANRKRGTTGSHEAASMKRK
jgi:hypothetical protein